MPLKCEINIDRLLNEENESRKLCYNVSCKSCKKKKEVESDEEEEKVNLTDEAPIGDQVEAIENYLQDSITH